MSGSSFVRADLHVHTVLGPGEAATGTPPSVDNMVGAARAAGLSVLGVTDHNGIPNVDAAIALAGPDLLVLPGIEVTAADGDVLGLFAPTDMALLRDFSSDAILQTRAIGTNGVRRSRRSVAELVREIGSRGGLAILAHIDTADGWLARATPASKADVLADSNLVGFEITQPQNAQIFTGSDTDAVRRQLYEERRISLGWRAPLARIMSSDAHSPEQVGVDANNRTLSRLRVDTLDFGAVKAALQIHPDSRCRIEIELDAQYPRVVRAAFVGGFLDGVVLDLSPNLNCLIGGRGSGKSTALTAIQGVLDGWMERSVDEQVNLPDRTIVEFIDGLGTMRRAVRERHGTSYEDGTNAPVSLETVGLEQNFGSELQADPTEDPTELMAFLGNFLPADDEAAEEAELLRQLEENARTLRQTTGATDRLKKLSEEKERLGRMLSTASDKNLAKVAEYAAALAAEEPLIAELKRAISEMPETKLPAVPNLPGLATEMGVDLSHEPASKFVPGKVGLEAKLARLATDLAAKEATTSQEIKERIEPALAVLNRWAAQHDAWERIIDKRSAELRAAGFSMQVDQLDKIRRDLGATDTNIRISQQSERTYNAAIASRKKMLDDLDALRDRRFEKRRSASRALVKAINAGSSTAKVTVRWTRNGLRRDLAAVLGETVGLRSPRKDRCAGAISPRALAALVWVGDVKGLKEIGGSETYFDDPAQAMKSLRTFDTLFELEVMDLPDVPEIRVRFEGDPPKQTRPLAELSLGQLRSVMLGFLLRSPGNAPLILDQPEEQLDGAFVAGVVVPYLHGAKEQRQLILATHNANIVVLGDAELVAPLHAAGVTTSVDSPGSVDNPTTQRQIVDLLEGGRNAFEQRGVRYGIVP